MESKAYVLHALSPLHAGTGHAADVIDLPIARMKATGIPIVLGSASALAALLVHSFLDFNMHIPSNAFLAVTLLAVISSHLRFATERYWFTARWPLALSGTLILVAILAWMVPRAIVRTQEVVLLCKADRLPDGAAQKIALLKQAFALQPKNFETAYAIGEQLRGD